MRTFIALGFLGVANLACAEFDLLKTAVYKPRGIVRSSYIRLHPTTDGGFFAVGYAADDILIVRYNAAGAVTASRTYDTPGAERERFVSGVDGLNRLYLHARSKGMEGSVLARFTSGLSLNMQLALPFTAYDQNDPKYFAVLPTGHTAFVVPLAPDNFKVVAFDPTGTQVASKDYPDHREQRIFPIPQSGSPAFGLFYKVAEDGSPGIITRLSPTLATAFSTEVQSRQGYSSWVADSSGLIVNAFKGNDWMPDPLLLTRVSASGQAMEVTHTNVSRGAEGLALGTGGRARVMDLPNRTVIEFDTSSLQIVRTYPTTNVKSFAENALSGRVAIAGRRSTSPAVGIFNYLTGTLGFTWQTTGVEFDNGVTLNSGKAAFGGTLDGQAKLGLVGANDAYEETTSTFEGYASRNYTGSATAPNGDVMLAARQEGIIDDVPPPYTSLAVFNASGALRFAHALQIEGLPFHPTQFLGLSDNSFVAAGPITTPEGIRIGVARVTSNGVIAFAKIVPLATNSVFVDALLEAPDGEILMKVATPGQLVKLNLDGSTDYVAGHTSGLSNLFMSGGKLYMGWQSGANFNIREINPLTGATVRTKAFTATKGTLVDIPGPAMCLVHRPDTRVRMVRIDESNFAVTHTGLVTTGEWDPLRIAVSPAGRVGVVVKYVRSGPNLVKVFAVNGKDMTTAMALHTLPNSVQDASDLTLTNGNQMYLALQEKFLVGHEENFRTLVTKFNADGSVALERRIERATSGRWHQVGSLLWLTGTMRVVNGGIGPFASKYTR